MVVTNLEKFSRTAKFLLELRFITEETCQFSIFNLRATVKSFAVELISLGGFIFNPCL